MRANLRFPLYASALFAFAMRRVPHPWRGLIGRKMGNEPSSQPALAPVPVLFLCSFVKEGGEAGDPSPENKPSNPAKNLHPKNPHPANRLTHPIHHNLSTKKPSLQTKFP